MIRRLIRDEGGNYTIIFSLLAMPLLLSAGLAVDYTNTLRVKNELQAAADSAALAVAQKGDTITDQQADDLGRSFFVSNFEPAYSKFAVKRVGDTITVEAKMTLALHFGGILGMKSVDLAADSTVQIENARYEIALSLDTTGSMAGGKLQSMKDAVNQMVDNLAVQNPRAGSLKFSIVPFSSMVNVGPQFGPDYVGSNLSRQPASWLDDLAKSPIPQSDLDPGVSRFAMYKHLNRPWPGCVETRPVAGGIDYGVNDEEPAKANPATLFVPAFASDDNDSEPGPNNYLSDAGGAIGTASPADRMGRYGAVYTPDFKSGNLSQQIAESAPWTNRSPDYSQQTYYSNYPVNKGPDFGCDTQPLMPLTTNFTAVKHKVDSLVARGSTNILEGVMWGWRSLSANAPLTEGSPSDKIGVRKIVVLLTDGTNSLGVISNSMGSANTSFGYLADGRLGLTSGTDAQVTNAMNDKTLAACTNAKADGIEIYTIRLEEPNVTTGSLLQDCASTPDHYLDVPDRTMLDEAFAKIARKIVQIRLSS